MHTSVHHAVRFQAPQDLAGVLARNTVEHGAVAVLLDEARDFTGVDGETLPVDDGVGRVRDREDIALLIERRLAIDHLRQGGGGGGGLGLLGLLEGTGGDKGIVLIGGNEACGDGLDLLAQEAEGVTDNVEAAGAVLSGGKDKGLGEDATHHTGVDITAASDGNVGVGGT